MMSVTDTPLFVKTHDFLLWLIRHTQRFPKNLRQSYTLKLELMAFDFQEAILIANAASGAVLLAPDRAACNSQLASGPWLRSKLVAQPGQGRHEPEDSSAASPCRRSAAWPNIWAYSRGRWPLAITCRRSAAVILSDRDDAGHNL